MKDHFLSWEIQAENAKSFYNWKKVDKTFNVEKSQRRRWTRQFSKSAN